MMNPLQIATPEKQIFSLWEIITSGGVISNVVMGLIFLLGLITIYIFIERLLFLKRSGNKKNFQIENVEDMVRQGSIQSAIEYCRAHPSPQSRMIEKGLMRLGRPISDISNAMEAQGQIEVGRLERNLTLLASCSGAAPMLGFLGTVLGMIMAFFEISNVTGAVSPKLLASGIYTAMATTAAGLIVGIPAYFFYNILVARIDRQIMNMQTQAGLFLDTLNKPA